MHGDIVEVDFEGYMGDVAGKGKVKFSQFHNNEGIGCKQQGLTSFCWFVSIL